MKKYLVFNGRKLIEIKASVIAEYEEKVGAVTDNTIDYLIATLGLTEDMDASALTEEIENAMIEDCVDSKEVKEMIVNAWMREYDTEDKAPIRLVLYGVYLGDYRNDIFCEWDMNLTKPVVNYEKFFCKKLEDTFHIPVKDKEDVLAVEKVCMEQTGLSVAAWVENWMRTNIQN